MGDLVASALEESERVCKKQRLCSTASTDAVDRFVSALYCVNVFDTLVVCVLCTWQGEPSIISAAEALSCLPGS